MTAFLQTDAGGSSQDIPTRRTESDDSTPDDLDDLGSGLPREETT